MTESLSSAPAIRLALDQYRRGNRPPAMLIGHEIYLQVEYGDHHPLALMLENPLFAGLFECAATSVGGSMQAAKSCCPSRPLPLESP